MAADSRLVDLGGEPFASSPTDFGKFIVEYTEKWGKVIRAAGIKAEIRPVVTVQVFQNASLREWW
jgi:hypothetical protein